MKRAALPGIALFLLLAGGCGDGDRTDCAIAQQNLDECVTEVVVAPSVTTYQRLPLTIGDDCSGMNACTAKCVKTASCDALRWVILGHPTDPNTVPTASLPQEAGGIDACLDKCFATYRKKQ